MCAEHMLQRHKLRTATAPRSPKEKPKPMPPTAKPKHGARAAFVRQFALTVPVDAIVDRAKARGLPMTRAHVYKTRQQMRVEGEPAAVPAAPEASTTANIETAFRKLALRIGYDKANRIVSSLLETAS